MDASSRQRAAAVVQIVSGLITMTVMCFVSYWTLAFVGAICTACVGGVGALWGILTMLLLPIGLVEVVAGILGLTMPEPGAKVMRIAAFVELASVLVGGFTTAVAGVTVLTLLREGSEDAKTPTATS